MGWIRIGHLHGENALTTSLSVMPELNHLALIVVVPVIGFGPEYESSPRWVPCRRW